MGRAIRKIKSEAQSQMEGHPTIDGPTEINRREWVRAAVGGSVGLAWLLAVFATTLSRDCLAKMEARRPEFQVLAAALQKEDPELLRQITQGHEKFLLTPTSLIPKPSISPSAFRSRNVFGSG
jgi:hypothetical protein